jgi:hypothetical protein
VSDPLPRQETVFMDGNRITPGTDRCVCGPDCEFPCWQRLGLTDQACCPGCPSLEEDPGNA